MKMKEIEKRTLLESRQLSNNRLIDSFNRNGSYFPVFNSRVLFPDYLPCRQFNIFSFERTRYRELYRVSLLLDLVSDFKLNGFHFMGIKLLNKVKNKFDF